MAAEIRVPQLGESVVEATVARWLKHEGEPVTAGDTLLELETEKVNVEVPAEASGVLTRIVHHEGDTVHVGDVVGILSEPSAAVAPAPTRQAAAPPPPAQAAGVEPAAAPPTAAPPSAPPAAGPSVDGGAHVTPVARRLAEEHGIDAARLAGTGPGGRVIKEDVLGAIEHRAAPAAVAEPAAAYAAAGAPPVAAPAPPQAPPVAAPARPEERVRLSRRRLTIARRLVEAQQTAAMLTTFNEIDMSAVVELRQRRRADFEQRHGVRLGFNSFFVKAAIGALKIFPQLNAELQGEELVIKRYYDIGIAVSTDEGLVVPVIRDADRKTFAELEREIDALATRARERKLTLEDLRGGTFTITNGGVFGSLLSTPILNPPQVGILGLHRIEERPIARDGQVVIHPMMYVALTYDHRVVDGREAVSFLVRVKELIEDPETLLLEG
jgi:2-oxoglutarate dehydrogenase E2 component (dihydrolipoamide succinyltransferase)